ncbi:MAG TPA: hypothetical protein DE312_07490 [Gallionella sp.]|nr:hypothetical protein [Gallionella sp.]
MKLKKRLFRNKFNCLWHSGLGCGGETADQHGNDCDCQFLLERLCAANVASANLECGSIVLEGWSEAVVGEYKALRVLEGRTAANIWIRAEIERKTGVTWTA